MQHMLQLSYLAKYGVLVAWRHLYGLRLGVWQFSTWGQIHFLHRDSTGIHF